MANELDNNQVKEQEGNALDQVFRDGTKDQNASNPLHAVAAFLGISAGLEFGKELLNSGAEILSNAFGEGGINLNGVELAGQGLVNDLNLNLGSTPVVGSTPTVSGMNGMKSP